MAPWADGLILIVALGLVGWGIDFRARRKRRGLKSPAGNARGTRTGRAADAGNIGPGTVINADAAPFRDQQG